MTTSPAKKRREHRVAAKCLSATLLALEAMSANPATAQSKQDIHGFTPGMSFADVKKLVDEKKYRNCNVVREMIDYGVRCDDINATMWFSPLLENTPLVGIATVLDTNATTEEVTASLSNQFGKPFTEEKRASRFVDAYVWDLGDGKILQLTPRSYHLRLFSPQLLQANKDERVRQSRVPVPKL
jgi:hypothetical protein